MDAMQIIRETFFQECEEQLDELGPIGEQLAELIDDDQQVGQRFERAAVYVRFPGGLPGQRSGHDGHRSASAREPNSTSAVRRPSNSPS